MGDCKNSKVFWDTINRYRKNNNGYTTESITCAEWQAYYMNVYPVKNLFNVDFVDVRHPVLDAEISCVELSCVLNNCRSGKAPGTDGISYEFYNSLPQNWRLYIVSMFNHIFTKEQIPRSWAEIIGFNLFKKGDKTVPTNYRLIALANSLLKIFTQIILNRLIVWSDNVGAIPESQNGFRQERGCIDNIFILTSLIQLRLSRPRGELYCVFIDFKRAFDSINHHLLWFKMHKIGISSKVIRIIKCLYDNASLQIRCGNKLSSSISITEGVLQGETLSPILFNFFISDIEMYFQNKGLSGIPVGHGTEISMLFYADDAVLFGDSYTDIRSKLTCLESFCKENCLSVNTNKTKIIRFAKSHRKQSRTLIFDGAPLEYVSSYNYLGIVFSNSGVFLKATDHALAKTRTAIGTVLSTCVRAKIISWEARIKMHDAVIMGTLLYAAHIWGLRYCDSLESCHLSFFKSLFALPRNTPNFAARLELGVDHIKLKLLKLCLNWLFKLKTMPSNRYPSRCFARLCVQNNTVNVRYNWISQLSCIFDCIDFSEMLLIHDPELVREKIRNILSFYANYLREKDIDCVNKSNFSLIYSVLFFQEQRPQFYLTQCIPFKYLKLMAQLRLSSRFVIKISIGIIKYSINPTELCSLCNQQQPEDLFHILFSCPMYTSFRNHYLKSVFNTNLQYFDYPLVFRSLCPNEIKKLFYFFAESLKLRSFILNE